MVKRFYWNQIYNGKRELKKLRNGASYSLFLTNLNSELPAIKPLLTTPLVYTFTKNLEKEKTDVLTELKDLISVKVKP